MPNPAGTRTYPLQSPSEVSIVPRSAASRCEKHELEYFQIKLRTMSFEFFWSEYEGAPMPAFSIDIYEESSFQRASGQARVSFEQQNRQSTIVNLQFTITQRDSSIFFSTQRLDAPSSVNQLCFSQWSGSKR